LTVFAMGIVSAKVCGKESKVTIPTQQLTGEVLLALEDYGTYPELYSHLQQSSQSFTARYN